MSSFPNTQQILAARPPKNKVDPYLPYAFLVEDEQAANGQVESVATIFLTNRECPFRCLMCDLWKNTTDETVPLGAIPSQIDFALHQMPSAKHVKLYNSGNFFDPRAILPDDHAAILAQVQSFDTVIVENHPRFCDQRCLDFGQAVKGEFEVAIGLETVHPQILPALNKQMTLDDFQRSVEKLNDHRLFSRAFILLRPPSLDDSAGIDWAFQSMEFAFAAGVRCCSIIPTRDGNGVMEQLGRQGRYEPPSLAAMEQVLATGIEMATGRVFMDLWDALRFSRCEHCGPARIDRMKQMNLRQTVLPAIQCSCS